MKNPFPKILTPAASLSLRHKIAEAILANAWGPVPSFSTLKFPSIKPVEVATIVGGAALVFKEERPKIILAQAGPHYPQTIGMPPLYMILGGFINLSWTPGSALVEYSEEPEHPKVGVAREIEEEMPGEDGRPLLIIDPEELDLIYTKTLSFGGYAKQLVAGFTQTVPAVKVGAIKDHVNRLKLDSAFRQFIADKTINKDSGKPEVAAISIHDLDEVMADNVRLLYPGQIPFFRQVNSYHFG